jgi:formate-nitrite transporter family protein
MDQPDRPPQMLDDAEQEQAAGVAPLRPHVIHEVVREEGEVEIRRSMHALAWSGFAAGGSMGFSFLGTAMLRAGLPDEPWQHLVESLGYSLGFVIVILGRQQLYTESTLTAALPVLTNPSWKSFARMARLWTIVLVANLLGTFLFAALILSQPIFKPPIYHALLTVSKQSVSDTFGPTVLKALLAGWLIALMVWLLPNARASRLWVIIIVTYAVSLGYFSHIIAGSTEAIFAVYTGQASFFGGYVWHFFIPTLIGGTSLVATIEPCARGRGVARGGHVILKCRKD